MGRSVRESDKSRRMFLAVLPFAFLASVNAHGGMTWPPTWQDGVGRPIEALTNDSVFSVPIVKDPNSGRSVVNIKSWLTDQAYTGGVGDEFKGIGPVTNDNNKKLPRGDRCRGNCVKYRNPWAAPGQAPCNHSRPRTCCHCCSRNLPVRSEGRCCQWPYRWWPGDRCSRVPLAGGPSEQEWPFPLVRRNPHLVHSRPHGCPLH